MEVIERKPVPIYEFVCDECKSRIQYKRSEVSFTDHVTCPVCGMTNWANTIKPIGWEYPKEEEQIIDPCDLVKDLAEKIGIHQLYAIARDMRGENTGKWEKQGICVDNTYNYRCSACRECIWTFDGVAEKYKFCPNCGADMRGEG